MPILTNTKHEAFAQHRAKGKTQDQAYKLAGFKPHRQNAHRLMTRDDVAARVQEIQGKAALRTEVTIETIADQLDEDRALALACKQAGSAVAASMAKAKLFGLVTDRSESTVTHNYASMTEDEVMFEIAAIHQNLRQIKAAKGRAN